MNIRDIKNKSKEQLQGRYWYIFIVVFLYFIISSASIPLIIGMFLIGPLSVGVAHVLLYFIRNPEGEDNFELLFEAFKQNFVNSAITTLIVAILVFLWSLLFIIPGIIKSYSYSMTRFILADEPDISPLDAIAKSQKMMQGHKMELFLLSFSYFGWYLLGLLTFGISVFYIRPFVNVSHANFYLQLKNDRVIEAEIW